MAPAALSPRCDDQALQTHALRQHDGERAHPAGSSCNEERRGGAGRRSIERQHRRGSRHRDGAASCQFKEEGFFATNSCGMLTNSAYVPLLERLQTFEKTSSPGRNAVTSGATASTTPAKSLPRIGDQRGFRPAGSADLDVDGVEGNCLCLTRTSPLLSGGTGRSTSQSLDRSPLLERSSDTAFMCRCSWCY